MDSALYAEEPWEIPQGIEWYASVGQDINMLHYRCEQMRDHADVPDPDFPSSSNDKYYNWMNEATQEASQIKKWFKHISDTEQSFIMGREICLILVKLYSIKTRVLSSVALVNEMQLASKTTLISFMIPAQNVMAGAQNRAKYLIDEFSIESNFSCNKIGVFRNVS